MVRSKWHEEGRTMGRRSRTGRVQPKHTSKQYTK